LLLPENPTTVLQPSLATRCLRSYQGVGVPVYLNRNKYACHEHIILCYPVRIVAKSVQ
jgi:hypothetical protein